MRNRIDFREVVTEVSNRRSFVRKLGMAGAAAPAVTQMKGQSGTAVSAITDVDILNFALNLEYLEAEFYSIATEGKTIEQLGIGIDGDGTQGPTYGGNMVSFDTPVSDCKELAMEVAYDERTHVTLIRGALKAAGAKYVAKPEINLNGLGFGYNYEGEFFNLARIFEDIGVTAYGGAAPLIADKAVLGVAARILAAEAEHVAAIRLQLIRLNGPTNMLDGVDIPPPPTGSRILSLDKDGLSAVRTPGQVLALAYGAANVGKGGFFPQGVNGTINMSSTPA